MKKILPATLVLVIMLVITMQASAQVAAFNSLSLHFSNTILTTAQYRQILENPKDDTKNLVTKEHLQTLPATGYLFGDNKDVKPLDILATPATKAEPMAVSLERWIAKELPLQRPKRRDKRQ